MILSRSFRWNANSANRTDWKWKYRSGSIYVLITSFLLKMKKFKLLERVSKFELPSDWRWLQLIWADWVKSNLLEFNRTYSNWLELGVDFNHFNHPELFANVRRVRSDETVIALSDAVWYIAFCRLHKIKTNQAIHGLYYRRLAGSHVHQITHAEHSVAQRVITRLEN